MQNKGQIVSAAFFGIEHLTYDYIIQALDGIDEITSTRMIITDSDGMCLYDTRENNTGAGKYVLFPEVYMALSGKDVFSCNYEDGVTVSKYAAPITYYGDLVGSVYILDYENDQSRMIYGLERNLIVISIVLETAVIMVAIVMATSFSIRTKKVLDSFPHIRAGEYTYKIGLRGRDELSAVANEFDKLTDRLADSEELRRRFVSDASHELKTPLASIMLLTETILQNKMDMETEHEFIADINTEAERLNRMTQKLLLLSKSDSVNPDAEREVVDVVSVTERVLKMLQPVADKKPVTLTMIPVDDCTVLAPEDDIYQIIFNLVENAIKYNTENGAVSINISRSDEEVKISIRDTGVGIPEAAREHIFDRFYRVDKARSRAAGGAGLGLSIVHDMVKRNFGEIKIQSVEPQGTEFVVLFPYFGFEEGDTDEKD